MSAKSIAAKLRARRNQREFERVLLNASPTMRAELLAAAARSGLR